MEQKRVKEINGSHFGLKGRSCHKMILYPHYSECVC